MIIYIIETLNDMSIKITKQSFNESSGTWFCI